MRESQGKNYPLAPSHQTLFIIPNRPPKSKKNIVFSLRLNRVKNRVTLEQKKITKKKMFFKLIADTFSVARDSDHFIQLKALKRPKIEDQLWAAIEVVGDSKYARATTQSILETLEAVFFEKPELSAYERFEQALKEVNLIIKNLKEKRGKALGRINAILAIFSGQELHLTQANEAEAYLIRNGKLSLVSEGLSSRSDDLFVNIASGELRADDKLIFATGRLLRLITHSQLVQIFGDGVTEATEMLREVTMGDEELSLGAACVHVKPLHKAEAELPAPSTNPVVAKLKEAWAKMAGSLKSKTGMNFDGVSRRNTLIAAVALIVVLGISVSFLMQSRRNAAIREEYRTKIEGLYEDIQVANTKGYANDKETANTILEKVDTEARAILDTNYFRPETLALLDKVQEVRDNINHTDRLKDVVPFIDLKAKRPGVKAIGLASIKDNLYAFSYSTLFEVILDQVLEPRTLDDTEVVIAGSGIEDQETIAFLTQSGRIIELVNNQIKFANTEDNAWKGGVDLAAYGKNLYVLSPKNNQIYKYARLRDKYSGATEYNSDADVKEGISIAVDGDIYVLKSGGNIVRIYKSKVQPFRIDGLAADISDATQIFTLPELDNLYLLDVKNKRVVIVTKPDSQGVSRYYGQIVFDKLSDVQRIYVEKGEKKLYLLTSGEIYKLDI